MGGGPNRCSLWKKTTKSIWEKCDFEWLFNVSKEVYNCLVWWVMDTDVKVGQVMAEKTHTSGLRGESCVCLSQDVTSLSRCANICSNFFPEQSLPMRPGRICSCLHTAWTVIPEVPLNFPLSESCGALKLWIHRGWREKRHENYEPRFTINRANFLRYIYIYRRAHRFFFPCHSSTIWCRHTCA